MKNNIQGCTALVTGGSKGIGAAISKRLIKEGISHLVLMARASKEFVCLVAELELQLMNALVRDPDGFIEKLMYAY